MILHGCHLGYSGLRLSPKEIDESSEPTPSEQQMPVVPHKLTPETKNSFWVNLTGRGYATPRKLFRWCTERLKIDPSNRFIRRVVRENGEAVLVLGTRNAESRRRAPRTVASGERLVASKGAMERRSDGEKKWRKRKPRHGVSQSSSRKPGMFR